MAARTIRAAKAPPIRRTKGGGPCQCFFIPPPACSRCRRPFRHELARAERLGDVVIGADLQSLQTVVLRDPGGEHDDRHVRFFPQGARHVETVEAGKPEVEHDQVGAEVGTAPARRFERTDAVAGHDHVEAGKPQVIARDCGDLRLVVNDQDRLHRSAGVGGGGSAASAVSRA
jgi:hypothetical protein